MDVLMPQLGETVAEGKIKTWFKAVGDKVAPGDNLFEIETDKVTMEVPAISAGVLSEIRVPEGEIAPVGAVVALIGDAVIGGDGVAAQPVASSGAAAAPVKTQQPARTQPAKAEVPKSEVPKIEAKKAGPIKLDPYNEVHTPGRNFGPAQLSNGIIVTPLARRLAGEGNVDLARVRGSGPRGRIVATDVITALQSSSGRAATEMASGPTLAQVKALYKHVPYEEVPLDGMRKVIAARLQEASQSIPAFYLSIDVRMDRLLTVREEINIGAPRKKDGNDADGNAAVKLSVNDFIVKALGMALQRVPAANAVWAEDRILRFTQSDVGVAVAVEGGLLTPVVRHADTKSLLAISAELKDLAARARLRKLKPEEYQGGASAVSNLGMYGIREFTAIVNPPHATILAVGASERRPLETENGGVKFVTAMSVTLTCDHRVVDGALGAELLAAFKALIEAPSAMLI